MLTVQNTDSELRSDLVFQQLLKWALSGIIGGLVWESIIPDFVLEGEKDSEGLLGVLRVLLLFGVVQAVEDCRVVTSGSVTREGGCDESETLPADLTDPAQIAVWALKRAASRLSLAQAPPATPEAREGPPHGKPPVSCVGSTPTGHFPGRQRIVVVPSPA